MAGEESCEGMEKSSCLFSFWHGEESCEAVERDFDKNKGPFLQVRTHPTPSHPVLRASASTCFPREAKLGQAGEGDRRSATGKEPHVLGSVWGEFGGGGGAAHSLARPEHPFFAGSNRAQAQHKLHCRAMLGFLMLSKAPNGGCIRLQFGCRKNTRNANLSLPKLLGRKK